MARKLILTDCGTLTPGKRSDEVIIAVSPAFNIDVFQTLSKLRVSDVLYEILAGIEEMGVHARIARGKKTADISFFTHEAAQYSGSGIAIGLQSKGTIMIHQKDLYPLTNLELLGMAPFIQLEHYRAIGKNAAKYVLDIEPDLVIPPWSKTLAPKTKGRTIPLVALIQLIEEEHTEKDALPRELTYEFK